jgi:hypothetical protein
MEDSMGGAYFEKRMFHGKDSGKMERECGGYNNKSKMKQLKI